MINNQDREAFEKFKEVSEDRIKSNSENYDKAILTISTSLIGGSLLIIQWLASKQKLYWLSIFDIALVLLGFAILAVMISFQFGIISLERSIKNAELYYIIENDLEKLNVLKNKICRADIFTKWCNRISGLFFIISVFLLIAFTIKNIEEVNSMTIENKQDTPKGVATYDGVSKIHMTARASEHVKVSESARNHGLGAIHVTEKKGLTAPYMQERVVITSSAETPSQTSQNTVVNNNQSKDGD